MKKFIYVLASGLLMLCAISAQGQIIKGLGDRVKRKVEDRVNNKIDRAIDKTLDKTEEGVGDATKGGTDKPQKPDAPSKKNSDDSKATKDETEAVVNTSPSLATYSKFDFVPGEKMVASEDFEQDAVGDFPAKWNTNGSGEIVTTNKAKGRFLMTQKEVVFYPEWINNLPENFTLEFDLMSTDKFSYYSGYFVVGATTAKSVGKDFRQFSKYGNGKGDELSGFEIGFHPDNAGGNQGMTAFNSYSNNERIIHNEADQNKFSVPEKPSVHVSIWRQRNRLRVYLDDKKVWDLPKALPDNASMNSIYFRNDGSANDNDAMYFSNLRIAIGAPDTRNKLITTGKFVTHGILFDANSDVIKPTSYGAIKDIANVLMENGDVKVKIIGHTDADGDDKANLELSKRRANAVKTILAKEFGISDERLSAEGKGESQPIDVNNSPAGKANNRRVEFIKL